MERIGVRETRQIASRYLAQVAERREPVEITDHGRPVARLVPVISDDWANLIAAADVTPADPTIDIRDTEPLIATESASAILQRLRERQADVERRRSSATPTWAQARRDTARRHSVHLVELVDVAG